MKQGTIQQLIDVFSAAFQSLRVDVPAPWLEHFATTVHKAMSVEARHFHTPEHILHLANPNRPIQSLAALYHDIVYLQVDDVLIPEISELICRYFEESAGQIQLNPELFVNDHQALLTCEIFGLSPRQSLSLVEGGNEFLSALAMSRSLGEVLPDHELVKVIAYIEASIPFRGTNPQGQGPFDRLAERLTQVCKTHHIPLSPSDIDTTIKGAVLFSNKDVDSFSESDPGMFLGSTWKLLPETNIALRSGQVYSLRDYRQALQKMEHFLFTLDPENIFHSYRGVPTQDTLQRMTANALINVTIAREYLGIKLLAMGILEALAEITGGDAPLALFMGELQPSAERTKHLEDLLPVVETSNLVDTNSIVYRLLKSGRAEESTFDLKNSPISLFLYKLLGGQRVQELVECAKAMFNNKISATEFLNVIDAPIVSTIAAACASTVLTRRNALLQIAGKDDQSSSQSVSNV